MLVNLYLENYVLFDKQNLSFNDGLIAVTGDTGAGKSLIIDALGYLCGNRLFANVNKDKTKSTFIEAHFDFKNPISLKLLADNDIEADDFYIVSRTIDTNGKSISRVNGRSVTLGFLKELFAKELDIHTQRDNQYLLNKQTHLELLDAFVGLEEEKAIVKDLYQAYRSLVNEKTKLEATTFNEEEIDFLKFQLSDIEKVNPNEDEYNKLQAAIKELNNYETLFNNLSAPTQILNANAGVFEKLYEVKDYIKRISDIEPFDKLSERMESLYIELKDIDSEITDALSGLEYDEYEVNRIESRLYEMNHLIKRFGGSFESFNERHNDILAKIDAADNKEYILAKLDKQIAEALSKYLSSANKLSSLRKAKTSHLENEILAHLADLELEKARFKVEVNPKDPSSDGIDDIEFMVAMNKGFDLESLIKVASGGELSRLMLGLKVVFSKLFGISTVVFDEIDTGVSGSVASSIGQKMHELANFSQVFTITHLAQVAAYADQHYYVEKDNSTSIGHTNIIKLEQNEIIEKLALMATGIVSDNSLKTAEELYNLAKVNRGDRLG